MNFMISDKNVWIEIAHNYFEGITHSGKGLPIMQAQGYYVVITNNTFKDSTIGSAISVTSPNAPLVRET
jgi:hypothetical protein